MRLGDCGKGRCLLEQPIIAGGFGFAPGAADQLAESLDRQVDQHGLALDHESDQRGTPPLDRQPAQFPRMKNLGLAGDDAVTIGMDRLAALVGNADPTQHVEPGNHAFEVLQLYPFRCFCDPAEDRAVIRSLDQQVVEGGAGRCVEATDQVAMGLPTRRRSAGKSQTLDAVSARKQYAIDLEPFDDGADDRLSLLRPCRCPGRRGDETAIVRYLHRSKAEAWR